MDFQKEREKFEAESFVRDCLEEGVVYCLQENKYQKGCPETLFTAVCFVNGAWESWQAAKADVAEIENEIRIGTQVKIINPDDTAEYGIEVGDEGVVVWVGDFGTVFGVCIPKKEEVWSFESYQFEVISNEVQAKADVAEGFVLVEKAKLLQILGSAVAIGIKPKTKINLLESDFIVREVKAMIGAGAVK